MHCSTACLFDHLVGKGEQCWRDIEPERLRRFEVDDQLELCGLFDGKACGAFSFENATDIVACTPEQGWVIRSIRHQAADLHKLPCAKQRGDQIFVGEAYDRFSVAECQRIRKYEKRVGVFSHDGRECLREPLNSRMVHGSDYPVPVSGLWAWLRGFVDWQTYRRWEKHSNILERDYQLKLAMGFAPETFTRINSLLRLPHPEAETKFT